MARGIEEGDGAALGRNVVGADMLGDSPRFTRRDVGAADPIEQGGLAVVHVTHDGHHRGTRDRLAVVRPARRR